MSKRHSKCRFPTIKTFNTQFTENYAAKSQFTAVDEITIHGKNPGQFNFHGRKERLFTNRANNMYHLVFLVNLARLKRIFTFTSWLRFCHFEACYSDSMQIKMVFIVSSLAVKILFVFS